MPEPSFRLRFDESKILYWANKYQDKNEPKEVALVDAELRKAVQRAGCLDKSQLQKVAKWKAPRSAGHVQDNPDGYVEEITGWSFKATTERARIEVLRLLDGVEWPTASVILHLFHKERYPILDFRALWSLRAEVPKQYSFEFWWKYVEFCRGLADCNAVDMRTLDRALWQYSKDNQPQGKGRAGRLG